MTIWFHQHLDMVWASGGDRRIEKAFARVSGLPYHPMPQLAGSAVTWQNNTLKGTTAFAAELPPGRRTPPPCSGMCVPSSRRPHTVIGVPRFELGTSPTRTERATRLRHTPICGP